MGLFSRNASLSEAQEVQRQMERSEMMDQIMEGITENQNLAWILSGTYGDHGARRVIVRPYWFIIEISGAYARNREDEYVQINFQKSGYEGLHDHRTKSGGVISCARMCYLYASAMQARLKELIPDGTFEAVKSGRDWERLTEEPVLLPLGLALGAEVLAEFKYHVPVPQTKNLF